MGVLVVPCDGRPWHVDDLRAVSAVQYFRGKLFESRCLHGWWMLMMPSGFMHYWRAGLSLKSVGSLGQPTALSARQNPCHLPFLGHRLHGRFWPSLSCTSSSLAQAAIISEIIGMGIPAAHDKEQYYGHGIEVR